MKKIDSCLFLRLPLQFIDSVGYEEPRPPIELLYLSGQVHSFVDCQLIDAQVYAQKTYYLKQGYSYIGISLDDLINRIARLSPDMIVISCTWINQYSMLKLFCNRIKKWLPQCKIVAGGNLVNNLNGTLLKSISIDYLIVGEGELTLKKLIIEFNKGNIYPKIDGLGFKRGNSVIIFPPKEITYLDELELPLYELIDFNDYKNAYIKNYVMDFPYVGFQATRGCPEKCTFCSLYGIGSSIRHPSIRSIIEHLDYLVNRFKIRELQFYDINLIGNEIFAKALFKQMVKTNLHLSWYAEAGFAIWKIDNELLELAVASGMYRLDLPLETGSRKVRDSIMKKKGAPLKKINQIIDKARKLKINRLYGFIIVGNPGETIEDIYESLIFLNKLDLDYKGVRFAKPFPGTDFYELCKKKGYLPKDFNFDELWFGYPSIETEHFDRKKLLSIVFADRALALIRLKRKTHIEAIREIEERWGLEIKKEAIRQMEILSKIYQREGISI